MTTEFTQLCDTLTDDIKNSYEQGVTMEEAEKLAGKFLHAQLMVAEQLRVADLDSRMKKSGLKAVKAAVYMQEATKTDKKPSDSFLQAKVDMDEIVTGEQKVFDEAEVLRDSLSNYMNIFKDAHIHFRSIAKGAFSG